MKYGLRVIGFLAVFGLGMLAGGSLLDIGHAQKPTTETVQPAEATKHGANIGGCQCEGMRGSQVLYTSERMSIIQITAPENPNEQLTMLIDNRNFGMYYLRCDGDQGYYWSRVNKGDWSP